MKERWPAAMSLATAAEYLDCSRSYVENLIREGAFPAKPLRPGSNGDRRIRRVDLDLYLERVFEGPKLEKVA